jgi:hypothetical protein
MKKNLIIIFITSISCLFVNAQSKNEITILYLLPFHLQENSSRISSIKNSTEIYQIKQFEMMSFWLGSKMALQEYNYSDKKINIIVRDVVTDVTVLQKILDDSVLMKKVNLIIGPFYGTLFPEAANFSKKHNITIVNPFSTRFDFVENNPNVYKLLPPFISRPEVLEKVFLASPDEYNVILWSDTVPTPEMLAYKYYFNEKKIPFREVHSLSLPQNNKKKNLIIAFFENSTRVIHSVHTILNLDMQNNVLIVPEKWFNISELTEDFYGLPQLYFFANYFVNEKKSDVTQFQSDYTFNYDSPAELAAYSYQGYDITRFFIDLYFADFNTNNVKFKPLSYIFNWKQIPNGGFENINSRLIQIKDFELEEVFYNDYDK